MRNVHNIQEDDTIEEMGRRMLKIYATLEKNQA
jgi:hypothetical protein